jgi:hypothetical protein
MTKMKQVIAASLVMAIFSIFACGVGNEKIDNDKMNGGDHDSSIMHDSSAQTGVKLKDDKLNAVYPHYLNLTKALVNGDAAEARVASVAIETGAKYVSEGVTLEKSAAKITAAQDIKEQRREYSDLSNEFLALVKKSGLNSGEIYVDFCPMAMNNKGAYWLSANKSIKNPYFGERMLTCGEVKETIK